MEQLTQTRLMKFCKNIRAKYPIIQNLSLILQEDPDTNVQYIYLVLIKIKKSQRAKGYGSLVISHIVRLADEYNIQVRLYPTDLFGSDLNRLFEFYKKNGFVLIKNDHERNMVYFPQKCNLYESPSL